MSSKIRHTKELRPNLPPFPWEPGLEATSARTFSLTEINHNVIILSKLYTAERYLSRGRSIQPLFHFKGDADDTL